MNRYGVQVYYDKEESVNADVYRVRDGMLSFFVGNEDRAIAVYKKWVKVWKKGVNET